LTVIDQISDLVRVLRLGWALPPGRASVGADIYTGEHPAYHWDLAEREADGKALRPDEGQSCGLRRSGRRSEHD